MGTIELEGLEGWWKRPAFWGFMSAIWLVSRTPPVLWIVAAVLLGMLIGGTRALWLSRLKLRLMNLTDWLLPVVFVALLMGLTRSRPDLELPLLAYFGLGCLMQAANGLTFGLAAPHALRKANERNRHWLKKLGGPPVEPP